MILYFMAIGCFVVATIFVFNWWEERKMLGNVTNKIAKNAVNNVDFIISLKRYLSDNINYDTAKRNAKRPLLRQTAATTLKTGFGFCGENARVAVLMLNYAGIRAGRVYLFGNRWNHVVVEHIYNNNWYLFDAHNDPGVMLPDTDVCKILIEDIESFPNEYREENVWVESCRFKIARRIAFLSAIAQWRLPMPLAILSESPDLIKATLFLVAGFSLLTLKQIMIWNL